MNSAVALAVLSIFFSGALAFGVAWQERRSVTHWAFVLGMLALTIESIFSALSAMATLPEEMIRWQNLRLLAMSCMPGPWLFFALSYSRGDYQSSVRKWRFLLAGAFLLPVSVAFLYRAKLISSVGRSLEGNHLVFILGTPGFILNFLFFLGALLVLMNLERTFRASVGTMRWRIKFMLLGVGILFAARAYTSTQILLFHAIDLSLQSVNFTALLVGCLLVLRSLFREGHFEVNVYPSHSVLHNSFTVVLAGVYLVIVGLFAKVVSALGGEKAFTLKAFLVLVALVFFTMLLLSDRVRLRTRRFISRHFQRPIYDYRAIWKSFSESTASCIEPTELCRAAAKLVANIFQVLSVSIWLVDDKKEKLAFTASTSFSDNKGNSLTPQSADAAEVIRALRNHPEPIDIDSSTEKWAAALRRCHPDEFRKGGSRVCVPLILAGEVLGLMTLGDRVSGAPFLQQDFDLLKCIGDEVAAGLSNVQLSQKLLQAKELEAFQTMSAFFVHDLKNTASTLNLMLRNLPVHFDDPAFREDALRGIAKSVDHINHLIGRLGHLRHEVKINLTETDLNEVISNALADWEKVTDVAIAKELRSLPRMLLDREQILKVITNLVLNAREALSKDGRIQIDTQHNDGWGILTVADNGCGMSAEFLTRSLFRPFQTTKKSGLGIGMFQSKMIVEAHGGRIEAESELGKGTTFRIFLPLQKLSK